MMKKIFIPQGLLNAVGGLQSLGGVALVKARKTVEAI